jgi:hypothetical protein
MRKAKSSAMTTTLENSFITPEPPARHSHRFD